MLFTSSVLTKEFILSKVRQEDVFEYFTNSRVEFDTLLLSPLREDSSPTCTYKWLSDKLYFKDWSGHFEGDCFDLVQKLYHCNFYESLEIVASKFKLLDYSIPYQSIDISTIKKEKIKAKITVKWKEWDDYLLSYWKQFGITEEWLNYFKIAPVEYIWLNDQFNYKYSDQDPAFCYYFSENEMKIYFPLRKKGEMRFLTNASYLQGYDQLPEKGEQLIITKSYKDVVVLRMWGIYSIAPQAESVTINNDQYEDLSSRFSQLYNLYDFDYAGIKTTNKARKLYPKIKPLFLTNGRFKTINYNAKDPAEYVKNHLSDHSKILKLIQQFKNL